MFWIHILEKVESLNPPLIPFTSPSPSLRTLTLPNSDRLEMSTSVLGLPICPANSTFAPVISVYHSPAPSIVTLLTNSCWLIW